MNGARITFAVAAAGVLLALAFVVGTTAKGALTKAASPSGGAAQAVYCPPREKDREEEQEKAFNRHEQSSRKAFFAAHSSSSARAQFTKRQHKEHEDFKRKHNHCD